MTAYDMAAYREMSAFWGRMLDEDELWATEASRKHESFTPTGVHWRWEDCATDEVIVPDPSRAEHIEGEDESSFRVSLRSIEHFPSPYVPESRELPMFAIPSAEEVPAAVGGHIIRHDPARVLTQVASHRELMRLCSFLPIAQQERMVRLMIQEYKDRPGFDPAWTDQGEGS